MVMRFIEKIRKLTKDARSIENKYPHVAQTIKRCATRGSNYCAMHLTPEEIAALRAEGFTVDDAPYLFEHYIKW